MLVYVGIMVSHKKTFLENLSTTDIVVLKKEIVRLKTSNEKENVRFDLEKYANRLRVTADKDLAGRLIRAAAKPYAGTVKKTVPAISKKSDDRHKMKSRRRGR